MKWLTTTFAAVLMAMVFSGPVAAQQKPSFVQYLSSEEIETLLQSTRQLPALEAIRDDPATIDVKVGRVFPDTVREGLALSIVLPTLNEGTDSGITLSFNAFDIQQRSVDDYTLYSEDKRTQSKITLVVLGLDVFGTIIHNGEVYKLHPLGDGLTAIYRYDTAQLQDHPEDYKKIIEEHSKRDFELNNSVFPPELADSGTTIDVLVAYTERARREAGNIDALIQLAFEETNQAYRNSQIRPRLRLVGSYLTAYTEHKKLSVDLKRLQARKDGHLDEVHTRRDQYRADLVVLLVGRNSDACGFGYLNSNACWAFSVVGQNCATGYYSFAHELGHNQGAHHDPDAHTNKYFNYGHGFCNDADRWRTVMSYDHPVGNRPSGRCRIRVQNFSNPSVSYNSEPTGDARLRNNARVINETAYRVANFRQESAPSNACRPGFREAGTRLCISSSSVSARTYSNALVYCKDRGSRVANYGDLRYLYTRTCYDEDYNPKDNWIGNMVGDDVVLCGNRSITEDNDPDIGNFEGTCKKFDSRSFWCAYDQ